MHSSHLCSLEKRSLRFTVHFFLGYDMCLNKPTEHLHKTKREKVTMINDIHLKL